ncbi:uncharacterized protein LOC18437773 [Amborella trichopoda]|uniref:uncharacterized protein LOC18437773 n=1 Tax=Amborella trichopoda TaxID=13333 RepID=UPI0009C0CA81|nr:uncharacterized protein LOC18437773 [Amborella trichopoda]|eukprot:XP_006848035.3 uncharacterized protein LOC18437773 [Amborella trichopoda]
MPLALFFVLSMVLHGALAEIVCENLSKEECAFSISSAGKRCVLEKYTGNDGEEGEFKCTSSEVEVERLSEWIEIEECIQSCGLDRNSVGISSDSLLDPQFTAKLCASPCFDNCPNVVDLYFNLAAGEGVYLPKLCQEQIINPRRSMAELLSSGVAEGCEPSGAAAPAPSALKI